MLTWVAELRVGSLGGKVVAARVDPSLRSSARLENVAVCLAAGANSRVHASGTQELDTPATGCVGVFVASAAFPCYDWARALRATPLSPDPRWL